MNIYGKIAEFQKACPAVQKSADNPFFHSKYAPLNVIIETAFPYLWEAGLVYSERVEGNFVIGTIADIDKGDTITGKYPIVSPEPDNPQKYGGSVTYARRYLMTTMLSIALEDDDGNAASSKPTRQPNVATRRAAPAPAPDSPSLDDITVESAPDNGAAHVAVPTQTITNFAWPDSRSDRGEYLVGLCVDAQFSGNNGKGTPSALQQWAMREHEGSKAHWSTKNIKKDGSEGKGQYGLAVWKLGERYGQGSHRYILSALIGEVVDKNQGWLPGQGTKDIFDWLLNPDDHPVTLAILDQVVEELKADMLDAMNESTTDEEIPW